MEFWGTLVGVVRRKRVIIPAVLVALTLGALAFALTPPTYVARTTMVLTLTPSGGSESRDPKVPTDLTNPMLNFNDSLTTTTAILINAMNVDDVAKELDATGSTHLVVDDGRSNPDLLGLNGPFLHIQVDSESRATAARVAQEAQVLLRAKLEAWQVELDAPPSTYIQLVDVVPPGAPEIDRGGPTKAALLAAVLGGGLSIVIAYFVHQLRARRRGTADDDELTLENLETLAGFESDVDLPAEPAAAPEQAEPVRRERNRVLVPDVRSPEPDRTHGRMLNPSPWQKGTTRRTRGGR